MSKLNAALLALSLMLTMLTPVAAVAATDPSVQWDPGPGVVHHETGEPGEARYIVLHQAPPVATYRGGIAGLAGTSAASTGTARLDVGTSAAVAYREFLAAEQDLLVERAAATLGRNPDVVFRYDVAINGLTLVLEPAEAAAIASLAGVARIERDTTRELMTDNGPAWMGAGAVHSGEGTADGIGTKGEGVVVGIIDTGINHDHPSFADIASDGYDHDNPRWPRYYGVCAPATGLPLCNDKLIGVYDFTGTSPEDDHSHGSHTASTVAGNPYHAVIEAPTITVERDVAGVAPRANIISYKGCSGTPVGCPLSALLAAINQATIDGVDVINYSIGSVESSDPWADPDAQAFLGAAEAGIFVATSAGNEGPGADTVGSPADAPWVTTVGASTHDRKLANGVVDMIRGAEAGPADIFGKSLTAPLPATRIVYAGDYAAQSADPANAHKCGAGEGNPATGEGSGGDPWPAGTFDGEIVVCDRGDYGRVMKAEYVMRAGAGGFVLANDEANGDSLVADAYPIPGVHIGYDDGVVLKAWIAEPGEEAAAIRGSVDAEDAAFGDVMAGFSSRGKNRGVPSVIKPDVTAPGVDILAAYLTPAGSIGESAEFGLMSGTSMSSPHAAGAAALVRASQPDWSPDEVKSALMTTAFVDLPGDGREQHEIVKEDGLTPSDPFDRGSGRVNLHRAANAGFVLDVAEGAYTAADPDAGGDPSTLNIPSFADDACYAVCGWTRTITSAVDRTVTWTPSAEVPAGIHLTFDRDSYTLAAGETRTVTVVADVSDATTFGAWSFGEILLTPDDPDLGAATFPVAVVPETGRAPTLLHMHGNRHDGCTGDGAVDLQTGEGVCTPHLGPDDTLDDAVAASWGPTNPALDCTVDRCVSDPSWVLELDEPTTIDGPMTVEFWYSSPAKQAVFNLDFTIRVHADGDLVTEQRVRHNVLTPDTELFRDTIIVPEATASDTFVVTIDPFFITQESFIYYDSSSPCPGATGSAPCDSRVHLPVTEGDVTPPPPPPTDDVVLHFHGNVHDDCTGDGQADQTICDGPTLSEDFVLDPASPPARFTEVWGLGNVEPRGEFDPNWVWRPADPVQVEGPLTIDWWSHCPGCAALPEDWEISVYADGSQVHLEVVELGRLLTIERFSVALDTGDFQVSDEMVLVLRPVYAIPQEPTSILYDAQAPCSDALEVPCDSTVSLRYTELPNLAPVAADDFPPAVQAGGSVDVDVLVNDSDPNGDDLTVTSFTQPGHGSVSETAPGVLTYTNDGSAVASDSFTYTITDGELTDTATVHLRIAGAQLELTNSFVSARGWVKPGETYPFRIIVDNPMAADAENASVVVTPPPGAFFTQVADPQQGTASIAPAGHIEWLLGTVGSGETFTLVVEGRAANFNEDPRIVWKDLSSTAALTYDGRAGAIEAVSHGPKVIPPTGGYESARYGDRPFPVVPVDYVDRKHEPHHDGASIDAKINSPAVPGSTFNLFQEMSLGQLFPQGTVPSADIESADYSSYEHGWHFTQLQAQGACTGVTLGEAAGTPAYDERIVDGWYQLPGTTGYYGSDRYTTGGPIVGGELGVGALFQIDDACGPIGKAVYDAAHIADPEIDYSEFDTDKDGVVDFFMMLFVGCGGHGESQQLGGDCSDPEYYDNIWPHSSSLEFYYSDPETGLKGYVSDDQLRSLEDVPQCYRNDSFTAFDDCASAGGTGDDDLPVYVRVGPYNVNPETSIDNASVISHEYGHSLGLPDFYSLGGRSTYGDWNLMATDKGQHMDVFAKQEMGWVVPVPLQPGTSPDIESWRDSKVDTGEIHWVTPDGVPYTLSADNGDQNVHNAEAYVAKLPGRILLDPAKVANGASAPSAWWSGSGNDFGCAPMQGHNLDVYLPELANYGPGDTIELEFSSMYEIEWDYDYGFVMVSTDGGNSYQALPSTEGTTTPAAQNPYANICQAQYGNGITGTSESVANGTVALDRATDHYEPTTQFITDRFDLSQFAGQQTVLRFSYATDPGLAKQGWFIDDLKITVNGTDVVYESSFDDPQEDRLFPGGCKAGGAVASTCTAGWNFVDTTAGSPADHAYYLEMRDRSGFDVDGKGENDRAPIGFDPGLLLVYTDEAHGYGNTGADNQPAQTPVDAKPVAGDESPNLNDAAFRIGGVTRYSDASPLGWLDNYDDGTGEWRHIYDCLSFDVTRMTGHTTKVLDLDLEGDVSFTMGDGCVEFTYGVDDIENRAPTAVATAKPATAGVGETVTLDGSGSSDDLTPNGDLTYEWDVDGDGGTDLTGQTTSTSFGSAGTHEVTLTVTDGGGLSDSDTVTVTVVQTNGRPDAADDAYETEQDTSLTVPAPGVLGNDSDPDGDPLTASLDSGPAHGNVTLNPDGSFTYEPDAGFVGDDAYTYRVSDGSLDDGAVVRITVTESEQPPACPQGTDADDGEDPPVDGDTSGCSDADLRGSGHLGYDEVDAKGRERTQKISVKFDVRSDTVSGLRGELELKDRARGVEIDAARILSVEPGDGVDCNGTVLSGPGAFVFSAEGSFDDGERVVAGAVVRVCGQDNGESHNGANGVDQDVLFVACISGCSYTTDHPTSDDRLDGGNIRVNRPVTPPATASGSDSEASGSESDTQTDTSPTDTSPTGSSGADSSKEASGAQVVEMGPMFQPARAEFSLTPLQVVAHGADGVLAGRDVVVSWTRADGSTGSVTAVTDALGVATVNLVVLPGVTEYTALVDGLASNPVWLTGTVSTFT